MTSWALALSQRAGTHATPAQEYDRELMMDQAPWQLSDDGAAERLYRRHGLPNLIEGYAAFDDVLTRVAPFLMLVFVVNIVTSTIDHGAWAAVLGIAVGLAVVFGVHALVQHGKGLSMWARPTRVGPVLIALWLVVPFGVRWLIGGASIWRSLLWLLGGVGILGVATLFATFGLGSMTLWALRQIRLHISSVSEVLIKTLPLLLLTVLFFFFGAEAWQLMHNLPTARFLGGLSAFAVFGSALLIATILRTTEDVTRFETWADVHTHAAETGAINLPELPAGTPISERYPRRVRANIDLVLFFSQAIQVLLVFLSVAVTIVGIGLLVVRPATIVAWIGSEPDYLTDHLGARDHFPHTVTSELIKVSLFVAAFAAVQFAVQIASEGSSAHRVLEESVRSIRRALAVRLLRGQALGAGTQIESDSTT